MKHNLDSILERWNLLKHPFYQAWSAGELPVEALQVYAREYGNFIETLPLGWQTLNDPETAQEEREHAELWKDFTAAVGGSSGDASLDQSVRLTKASEELFSSPASALGALYAFEAQQPATAKSKLDGLRERYRFPQAVEPYFEVHSANGHEAEKVLRRLNDLPADEREVALAACERMAESLWDALTGIHEAACS
ncbi:MAG: hypothetical protein DCC59_08905 [Chloroflexi bacterium]|nr:hypothetical protein [Chloroflexi bacterium CFX1]MCK6567884.1 iron-containing redox enzyme family protein [Anaerolineales bacterium]MCQ3952657.1 hypothetical protein [Chloroflexota bacterium]MDL1919860.1 hypothetical protein [Chloroflexi bacterium CFX5]NUQ58498.1 iron-containing redox enzyme family protein [Anaerolineales bacterium]